MAVLPAAQAAEGAADTVREKATEEATEEALENEPLFNDAEWQTAGERTQGVRLGQRPGEDNGNSAPISVSLTRMIGGLVVVIALALVIAWLVRRTGLHRRLPGQRGEHLELLESLSLGPKRGVSLLRVGGHFVVVGHNEQSMTALATLHSLQPTTHSEVSAPAPAVGLSAENTASSASAAELPSGDSQSSAMADAPPAATVGNGQSVEDFRQRLSRLLGGQGR